MINRQDCYTALFKLKDAGIDITAQLTIMQGTKGVPYEVLNFLRNNSPQFQFYGYIQKRQKGLAKSLLNYTDLEREDKIIAASSFVTRVYLATKYQELSKSLVDDLNVSKVITALEKAIVLEDYRELDNVMKMHGDSLRLFYKSKTS